MPDSPTPESSVCSSMQTVLETLIKREKAELEENAARATDDSADGDTDNPQWQGALGAGSGYSSPAPAEGHRARPVTSKHHG
jgi:hypothetical protein